MKKLLLIFVGLSLCSNSDAMRRYNQKTNFGQRERSSELRVYQNTFRVPRGMRFIPKYAFKKKRELHYVDFRENNTLEKIGQCAFNLSGLREICIPASVNELCEGCFGDCSFLSLVTFAGGSHVRMIGAYAFANSGLPR